MAESTSKYNILANATPADIRLEPYPHLLLHDALPAEIFAELEQGFPDLQYIAGDDAQLNNHACLRGSADVLGDATVAPAWRDFFNFHLSEAFFRSFVDLWAPLVARSYPHFEENFHKALEDFTVGPRATGRTAAEDNFKYDLVLDCVFGANTPVRAPSQVRGPHADIPHKLFSSLLYFRDPADDSTGGEYQLYGLKRRVYPRSLRKRVPPRYVDAKINVPYQSNTLIFWLNGAESLHAVTNRSITPFPRRYVAVTGECYGGEEAEGYFAQHAQWQSPVGRARSWLNI